MLLKKRDHPLLRARERTCGVYSAVDAVVSGVDVRDVGSRDK